ncbi:hypothetical protein MZM54_01575 [[Brevibacterium] frigoritolerans]|nr:hypothetical protein [Peribacillus frigoritolerans]
MSSSSISNIEYAVLRKKNIIINFVFLLNAIITSIVVISALGLANGLPVASAFIVGTILITILNLTKKYTNAIPYIAVLVITIGALIPNQPPIAYMLSTVYILVCGAFYLDKKLFVLASIGYLITLINVFVVYKSHVLLGTGIAAPLTFFIYFYAILLAQQTTASTFLQRVNETTLINEEKLNIYRCMSKTDVTSIPKK